MAFFKKDYNKPGPGVPKNAPRKKGVGRFFELLGRDSGNILKLNVLVFLCQLPSIVFFLLAMASYFLFPNLFWLILFLVLALVASILVGPARTAEAYLLTKMMRDDPGYIVKDFKEKFKENFKSTRIPGILYCVIVGAQIFTALTVVVAKQQVNAIWIGFYLLSILLVAMASPYYFVQAGYLDMKAGTAIKNSLLLALGFLPRSFVGAIINLVLLLAQIAVSVILFPIGIIIPLLFGVSVPNLINLMWVWPPIDKTFKIEKTLKERNKSNDNDGDDVDGMPKEANDMLHHEDEKEKQEKREAKEIKHAKEHQKLEKELNELGEEGLAITAAENPTL